MKILFLAPYPPYPPHSGGALRIYNLLRQLCHRHELWCLTFAPDAEAQQALLPLRDSCRVITVEGPPRRSLGRRARTTLASPLPDMALRNVSAAYSTVLRQLLSTSYFDIVQAESIEMARYGLLAAGYSACLVLDEFNAEYVLQRRAALIDLRQFWLSPRSLVAAPYSLMQWPKLARYEQHMLRHYHHILTVSQADQHALLRLRPRADRSSDQISIVPNGVDTSYFRPSDVETPALGTHNTVVFTGTLDFRPNIDAVLWFARKVLPLVRAEKPDARFVVVGRNPAPAVRALHDGGTIIVHPDVEDVRPYIAAAAIYVVPMRMGGGVRLKLLEALSMQAATVSTSMGAEGVDGLRNGEHLLLADTPQTFAGAMIRLLNNPRLGQQLGRAGRGLAKQDYDWQVIVPRLEQTYTRLLAE